MWLNPPYGRETWDWLARLAQHGEGTALIFARTETEGFVCEVWGKASALLFLHGRLSFCNTAGLRAKANSGAPSVLVAYGERDADVLSRCTLPGTYVTEWGSMTRPVVGLDPSLTGLGLATPEGMTARPQECLDCDGTGYKPRRPGQLSREHCPTCEGSGLRPEEDQ